MDFQALIRQRVRGSVRNSEEKFTNRSRESDVEVGIYLNSK